MVAKQRKIQMELAFDPGRRGETLRTGDEGTEATMAKNRTESSASMTRSTVRTAVYVTRMHGGVGGGASRGALLSRLSVGRRQVRAAGNFIDPSTRFAHSG